MNRLIAGYEAERDADLMICAEKGVAYQADMRAGRVEYDEAYFEKCAAYRGCDTARAVNAGRCAMLARHLAPGASVIDIGAGTGEFLDAAIESGFKVKGFDINPQAAERLWRAGLYDCHVKRYDGVTAWDVVEHMEDPEPLLQCIRAGAVFFVSTPIFRDLRRIRESRHYRPGEHLYYWTERGLIDWLASYGFRLLERSSHEIEAGRDNIGAFAFRRYGGH